MRRYCLTRPVTVPKAATPLIQRLFAIMHEERIGYSDLAERSGLAHGTLCSWRRRNVPRVIDLDAALNALGYELVIRPIAADAAD